MSNVVTTSKDQAWWGVDLDGTLAVYESWIGPDHVGEPVMLMVERIKRWLALGRQVKIFTARVNGIERETDGVVHPVFAVIEKFCLEVIGQVLPITCAKDYHMIELWDDRCVQIIPNTGLRADEANATRYFLGCDNDCHDYLVPFDKKGEWEQWVASISVDVFSMSQEEADAIDWNPPSFARRIDNAFCITFTDPKEF